MVEVKLRVAEAIEDDANKGFARFDEKFREKLGVSQGDIVEITGKKSTVAIVEINYPGDKGLDIIRLDGRTRWNAGCTIREQATVRKADIKDAVQVVIGPAKDGFNIAIAEDILKGEIIGRIFMKGDVFKFSQEGIASLTRTDILRGGIGSIRDLSLLIEDTEPSGPVKIAESTKIRLQPEENEIEGLRDENIILRRRLMELENRESEKILFKRLKEQDTYLRSEIQSYRVRLFDLEQELESNQMKVQRLLGQK